MKYIILTALLSLSAAAFASNIPISQFAGSWQGHIDVGNTKGKIVETTKPDGFIAGYGSIKERNVMNKFTFTGRLYDNGKGYLTETNTTAHFTQYLKLSWYIANNKLQIIGGPFRFDAGNSFSANLHRIHN